MRPVREQSKRNARAVDAAAGVDAPRSQRAVRPFVVRLIILVAVFYAAYYYPYAPGGRIDSFFDAYLRGYARAAGGVLHMLGENVRVVGTTMEGRFALRIVRGCDAIDAKMLFVAAVLAFPAAWRQRLLGIVIGLLALSMLNLTRIVSLYFIGVWRPAIFEAMHIEVWQALFVLLSVAAWVVWAVWVARGGRRAADAGL